MKKLILSATFLSLGCFAMAQQTETAKVQPAQTMQSRADMSQRMQERQNKQLEHLTKELNLTPDQVTKIQNLRAAQRQEIMNSKQKLQGREKMMQLRTERDAQMKEILSAEQYQKWTELKSKQDQKMMNRRMMTKQATPQAQESTQGK